MMAKWRHENRSTSVDSLTDALNDHARPGDIAHLIADAGRGNEIIFVYTKPDGEKSSRHVTVEGVIGDSIRALDHKDSQVKSFRIDRISKARRA